MAYYVGLDVSVKVTAVCIVDGAGTIVRETMASSEPAAIAAVLGASGLTFERVGLEAGPLSAWLHDGLSAAGLPAIVVEARHMKTALAAMRNKTDRKDAHGIAQMMRLGWFRQVHVKSEKSRYLRLLLVSRAVLRGKRHDIENTIRGTLKTFGLKVGRVSKGRFEERVTTLIADRAELRETLMPLLTARAALLTQFAILHRRLVTIVRADPLCRLLMTAPGVGPVVAATFVGGVDDPARFVKSASVGAHFGLTPRTHASGEAVRTGAISKCGDAMVRTALYEAANTLLTRGRRRSSLKAWGLRIAKRAGRQKAKVAVARKLAVILHRMWCDGTPFRWETPAA